MRTDDRPLTTEEMVKFYLDDPETVVLSSSCEFIAGSVAVTIRLLLRTGMRHYFNLIGDTALPLFRQAQERTIQ